MRRWLAGGLVFAAGAARAETEIAGRAATTEGRPEPGADVVATGTTSAWRRATVAGPDGRFVLLVPDGEPVVVRVYTGRGGAVAARVVEPASAARVWLEVAGGRAVSVRTDASPFDLRAVAPRAPSGEAAVRGRDLADLVAALPAGAPAAPATLGPGLLGADVGEVQVSLDGLALADPLDGRAPLALPGALFDRVDAGPDLGGGVADARGGARLRLGVGPAGRQGAAIELTPAFAAAPRGARSQASASLRLAGRAQARSRSGRAGLVLAAAPVWNDGRAAEDRPSALVRQNRDLVPVVARADLHLGPWSLRAHGLAFRDHVWDRPGARVVPLTERAKAAETWLALGASARRWWSDGVAMTLRAAALRVDGAETTLAGGRTARDGYRVGGAGEVTAYFALAGAHRFRSGAGVDGAVAGEEGGRDERPALAGVGRARGRNVTPWVGVDERWEIASVALDAGLRVQRPFLALTNEGVPGVQGVGSGVLWLPRLGLTWRHADTGSALEGRAGRYAAPFPVAPLLGVTAPGASQARPPYEDVVSLGGALQLGPVRASVLGLERRTGGILEDAFVPGAADLRLVRQPDAGRRYQALVTQAEWAGARTRVRAAYTASRLRGNFGGFADLAAGRLRPYASGAFDRPDLATNADGPLPLDRRHGLRAAAERRTSLGGFDLLAGVAGRLDSGPPLSARGRSAVTGTAETFLIQRGSAGRLPWTGAVDATVALRRTLGSARLWLFVEGYNLTNARRVSARSEVFTDRSVAPLPGARGRGALAGVRAADGAPVSAAAGYGQATAWTEPLLLRLGLRVEL